MLANSAKQLLQNENLITNCNTLPRILGNLLDVRACLCFILKTLNGLDSYMKCPSHFATVGRFHAFPSKIHFEFVSYSISHYYYFAVSLDILCIFFSSIWQNLSTQ